ncbi:MAG: HAMP domain-containing histidine kinase [Polyangiaceae bacterium]|nr:HAMP domain-containing histidine kinase [Polyangiaceae bacterium]
MSPPPRAEAAAHPKSPSIFDKTKTQPRARAGSRVARHGLLITSLLLAIGLVAVTLRDFLLGAALASVLGAASVFLWLWARREETLAEKMAEKSARDARLTALETMSAVLAHEIKNPLAALKGNAQLVAEALPDGTLQRAQAERVVDASIRLQSLVINLLDFIRGDPLARALVDPAEILFLAAEDAGPSAELELDAAPPLWSLDAARARQMLVNLLRNAVQAADGGRVLASVSVEGDSLVYSVRDEGPGLPKGPVDAIFEPFFTTKTRGIGLGLPVARRIAELHGGEITARSRPEGGAEFRVVIPRN